MTGIQVARNRFHAIGDDLSRSAERIPQRDFLQNMQPIHRLAHAIAGSIRISRIPVYDTRVVVWVDVYNVYLHVAWKVGSASGSRNVAHTQEWVRDGNHVPGLHFRGRKDP